MNYHGSDKKPTGVEKGAGSPQPDSSKKVNNAIAGAAAGALLGSLGGPGGAFWGALIGAVLNGAANGNNNSSGKNEGLGTFCFCGWFALCAGLHRLGLEEGAPA